jgi:hypothetical protein
MLAPRRTGGVYGAPVTLPWNAANCDIVPQIMAALALSYAGVTA